MYTTHRKMRGKLTPRTAKVWPSLATTAHDRRRRAAPTAFSAAAASAAAFSAASLSAACLRCARGRLRRPRVYQRAHAPRTTLFVSQVL